MRRWLALGALLSAGCATTAATPSAGLDSCSLATETACVAYGATVAGVPPRPSAQLIVGLAARSASMPSTDAVDYWRRIVEIHAETSADSEVVNRLCSKSYAGLAVLAVDDVSEDRGEFEETIRGGQAALENVRELASFAVKWGTPEIQLDATAALSAAYRAQASNLDRVELPEGLTVSGRAALTQKRDAIAAELRDQARQLDEGILEHCRRHSLGSPNCASELETKL